MFQFDLHYPDKKDFETLLKFGGFPEPLLKAEVRFWQPMKQLKGGLQYLKECIIVLEFLHMVPQKYALLKKNRNCIYGIGRSCPIRVQNLKILLPHTC